MKKIAIFLVLVSVIVLTSMHGGREMLLGESLDRRESTILYTLMGIADYLHFLPRKINDDLSEDIYDDYIKNIDANKRFLLSSEVKQLAKQKKEIDDQIENFAFTFFDSSEQLMIEAIIRAEGIYKELMAGVVEINQDEFFELDANKRAFAQNESDLRDIWRKYIKYNVVSKMNNLQEFEKNKDLSEDDLYDKAKEDVQKLFDDWFERLIEVRRADRFDVYINTIMHQFDPHTEYFSPKKKENFDIQMGNKLEGIGARLQQDEDYVKVFSIVPGGPAWKEGNLEVDDLIVSVQQKDQEVVDITGMRLDDVIRMIRGDKGTTVILRVKKKSGAYENVAIERDEVILDDAAAKSVILGIENQVDKIGYINLPLFYSTFDGGNSCAKDVEEEIEKLNQENVNGIILDLRYNGGGSLPDVIDMAGLFIEKGPILQVKSRDKKPQVYYDKDKSVKYDGPLIVMVNEVSASSSEILVGALKDYKRAVIVGGEKTFGKATVQGVYDLDRMISEDDNALKPLGQVKLTTQKFFRINGSSNQLRGITSDIVLPDQFSFTDYGESEYEDALEHSEIASLEYAQDVYVVKNYAYLTKKSASRVKESKDFQLVEQFGKQLAAKEEDSKLPISFRQFRLQQERENEAMKPYDNLFENEIESMTIKTLEADVAKLDADKTKKGKHDAFIDGLKKDFYLQESLYIMRDILNVDKGLVNN